MKCEGNFSGVSYSITLHVADYSILNKVIDMQSHIICTALMMLRKWFIQCIHNFTSFHLLCRRISISVSMGRSNNNKKNTNIFLFNSFDTRWTGDGEENRWIENRKENRNRRYFIIYSSILSCIWKETSANRADERAKIEEGKKTHQSTSNPNEANENFYELRGVWSQIYMRCICMWRVCEIENQLSPQKFNVRYDIFPDILQYVHENAIKRSASTTFWMSNE